MSYSKYSKSIIMIAQHLTVLIVESEAYFAKEVVNLVEAIGVRVIASIQNISEVFSIIKREHPNLILLNANIQEQSKEEASILTKIKALKIPIIFIASFKEDYNLIKNDNNNNAIGLMVKPANKFTLKSCIEMALKEQTMQVKQTTPFVVNRELFFKKGGVYHKIDIDNIYFFQANGDYSLAQTFRGTYTTSIRLNKLEELLQNHFFMRIHRSYLINLAEVNSIDLENCWLSMNSYKIPFSRRIKTKLLNRLPLL